MSGRPTLVQFDNKFLDRLILEKKVFKKELEGASNSPQNNDHSMSYYLLSNKFIREWKVFSGYDSNNINVTPTGGVLPSPFNEDISKINPSGLVVLNSGLSKDEDFAVISADLNNLFRENYKGNVIQKRLIRRQSGDRVMQIYQIKFKYFFISQTIIREIDCGPQKQEIELEEAELSRYLTLQNLRLAAIKIFVNSHKGIGAEDARIWKLDSHTDIKDYHQMVRQKAKSQNPNKYFIEDPKATQFDNELSTIEQLSLSLEDTIMIQILEPNKDWVIRQETSDGLCPGCQFYIALRVRGTCKEITYCSAQCKQKDQLHGLPSHKSSQSK